MVQKLSEIKAESGRDLDSLVDENLLIPAETGAGTFGVLRFFQGIKNFFKGITALKTLSSTGRIPITDANGNVNYVTPQQILDAVSTINGDKNFANNVSVDGALNVNGENIDDKFTNIIATEDLNTLVPAQDGKPRMWYSPSGSPSNKPDGSNIWSGIVYNLWGYPIQIAHSLGNKMYSRTGYTNNGSIVWNNWNQIARTDESITRVYISQNGTHDISLSPDNVYLITVVGALTQTAFPLGEIFFAQNGRIDEGCKFVSLFNTGRFTINKSFSNNVLHIESSIGTVVKAYLMP